MCGIVGYVGPRDALPLLMTGLRRLEYRGYDSAGVAVQQNGTLEVMRAEGKLDNLASVVSAHPAAGHTGIGHTRWATHGRPSEQNAHPHVDCGGVTAVIHNGIIENFEELKAPLVARGHRFTSETDTEVAVHMLEEELAKGSTLDAAALAVLPRLEGAAALAFISAKDPGKIVAARIASAPHPQPMSRKRSPGASRSLVQMWSSFCSCAVSSESFSFLKYPHEYTMRGSSQSW